METTTIISVAVIIIAAVVSLFWLKRALSSFIAKALKSVNDLMVKIEEHYMGFVMDTQDSYYNDKLALCLRNCVGRETGSSLIDHKIDMIGEKRHRSRLEKDEQVRLKKLQESKEIKEVLNLCAKCHAVASCAGRGDSVTECDDYIEEESGEEVESCDCADGCTKCDDAQDEQNDTEAREEV